MNENASPAGLGCWGAAAKAGLEAVWSAGLNEKLGGAGAGASAGLGPPPIRDRSDCPPLLCSAAGVAFCAGGANEKEGAPVPEADAAGANGDWDGFLAGAPAIGRSEGGPKAGVLPPAEGAGGNENDGAAEDGAPGLGADEGAAKGFAAGGGADVGGLAKELETGVETAGAGGAKGLGVCCWGLSAVAAGLNEIFGGAAAVDPRLNEGA